MTDPAEPIDRELLASSFEHSAEAYERGRPGYPDEALDHLDALIGFSAGRRVLDLAAGTGKLARQLLARGADVVAVEPSAAMRAQFSNQLPGVEVLDGNAESIPLPDASLDAVVVAQAFHWFDHGRALAEIARVLRPGGWLVAIWNEASESSPDVKRVFDTVRTVGRRVETIEVDWRVPFDESGHFEPARRGRFRWTDSIGHDELIAAIESRSYVTLLEPATKAEFLGRLRDVVAELPEPVLLPYVTEVYWCRTPAPGTRS